MYILFINSLLRFLHFLHTYWVSLTLGLQLFYQVLSSLPVEANIQRFNGSFGVVCKAVISVKGQTATELVREGKRVEEGWKGGLSPLILLLLLCKSLTAALINSSEQLFISHT